MSGMEPLLIMQVAATAATVIGGISQADAMRDAAARNASIANETARVNAENARITAEANQQQLEYSAGQSEAAGQHEAEAKRRKADLMLSRAQAVAAASGGGPLDESLFAGIVGEGEREAGYSLYQSREQAAGSRYRGAVGVYEANARGRAGIDEAAARGSSEMSSANRAADATLLSSFGSAASKGSSLFTRSAPSTFPLDSTPSAWDLADL